MRSFGSLSLGLGVAAIAASGAWTGCSSTKVTEIIPGASTQIQVPLDLAAIRVDVRVDGAGVVCQQYYANDGSLVLPATIGVVPSSGQSPSTIITVEVRAYDTAGVENSLGDLQGCGVIPVGQPGGPRILRRSIQSFVDGHELFLPMPLSYSCLDRDCSTDSDSTDSCHAGACSSSKTDPTGLTDFNTQLIDGTGNCFDTSSCFADVAPALPIDASTCLFQFPEAQVPAGGLNVRVFYQPAQWFYNTATLEYEQQTTASSEQEVLNVDPAEGFTIPDPTKPQQFALAPGLCTLYQQSLTPPAAPTSGTATVPFLMITDVDVASACDPKSGLLPICAPQQKPITVDADGGLSTAATCGVPLTLEPSPSVLYLVMDSSKEMDGAFGPQGSVAAFNALLTNPVFRRTYVAFTFLDHCAGGSYLKPSVDFALAPIAHNHIAPLIITENNLSPSSLPLDLVAATNATTGAVRWVQDFSSGIGEDLNTSAVMFMLNRMPVAGGGSGDAGTDGGAAICGGDLTAAECSGVTGSEANALAGALQAATSAEVSTYYVVLSNDNADASDSTPPTCFYDAVATLAGQQPSQVVVDATLPLSQGTSAITNFAKVGTELGTCVYELPPGVDSSAQMKFIVPVVTLGNPVAPAPVPVPNVSGCTAAAQASSSPPNGWSIEGKHIRVCGTACTQLQAAVGAVTAASTSLDAGLPDAGAIPEVPVTVEMTCQGSN